LKVNCIAFVIKFFGNIDVFLFVYFFETVFFLKRCPFGTKSFFFVYASLVKISEDKLE
jgi:hypothetical protein